MSRTHPENEYEALLYTTERLQLRFPGVAADVIQDLVLEGLIAVGGARIRTYVPALVEAHATHRLRQLTRQTRLGALAR